MNTFRFGPFIKTIVYVAVLSVVANLALDYLGRMIVDPPHFGPYMYGIVTVFTLIGVLGASVVYALMRFTIKDRATTNKYYTILSLVLLVISFYPDVMLMYSPRLIDVDMLYVPIINLMIMHAATAGFVLHFFRKPTV